MIHEVSLKMRVSQGDHKGTLRSSSLNRRDAEHRKEIPMGYGIGGILITILVILAIIYFAKRV